MTEIRKIVVCDICGKEITPSMLKWRSTGARLRFYKRDFIDRPAVQRIRRLRKMLETNVRRLQKQSRGNGKMKNNISLCSLLTVAFVVLRLCGVIDWNLWWVLSPLWIPFAIAFIVMGALGLVAVIVEIARRASHGNP